MPRVTQRREMRHTFEGMTFYQSSFDPRTGTIVRAFGQSTSRYGGIVTEHPKYDDHAAKQWEEKWSEQIGARKSSFPPVPEVIDVKVTSTCGFGCSYCYMDSLPKQGHPDALALLDALVKGCGDNLPYQIAYGGGEPTSHPDFPELLRRTAAHGIVPNYTTAGHIVRPEVIKATNECVGGVSLTFHRHKGIEWFAKTYTKWRDLLDDEVKLGIHVIADCDVHLAIRELVEHLGKDIHIILLAYYPDVGRGSMSRIMPKNVYMDELPKALIETGVSYAFAEGLLPYFLSRPSVTPSRLLDFSGPQEGVVSCYVDELGYVSTSSFQPPRRADNIEKRDGETDTESAERIKQWSSPNLFDRPLSDIWKNDRTFLWNVPRPGTAGVCAKCPHSGDYNGVAGKCVVHHTHHQLICAWQEHNDPFAMPALNDPFKF